MVGPHTTRLGRNASALAIGGSGVAPKRAHRASWSALNSPKLTVDCVRFSRAITTVRLVAVSSRLAYPIEIDTSNSKSVEPAHLGVTGAITEEHCIAHEMDRRVAVPSFGIGLDDFAHRPGLPPVV